jgi:hypothetical protein
VSRRKRSPCKNSALAAVARKIATTANKVMRALIGVIVAILHTLQFKKSFLREGEANSTRLEISGL